MKAVVFHGIGDIRIDSVPEPKIKNPQDAIVRLTAARFVEPIFISSAELCQD